MKIGVFIALFIKAGYLSELLLVTSIGNYV